MTSQSDPGPDPGPEPAPQIAASYLSLIYTAGGALLYGLGCLAVWANPEGGRLAWAMQVIGPLLVAVGVTISLEHLLKQLGAWVVNLSIAGLAIWALSGLPFLIQPALYALFTYTQVLYLAWALAYLLFAVALFCTLARKESRLAKGEDSIHASFLSLTFGAVGWMLFGLGFLALAENLVGTRFVWGLQAIGPILIALALATHIDHLTATLGRGAVSLAIIGAFVWSLTTVAFVFDPELAASPTWGPLCFWGIYGSGIILGGLAVVAVIARKRAQAHEAKAQAAQ